MERQLSRECAVLHQQHSATRRRHASGWLSRRTDAPGQWLRRCHCQARKDCADRRRLPRGPDRGTFGESARSEIFLADQGQAGVLGSASGGRERPERSAGGVVRGTSRRGQGHRRQGGGSRRRPRSCPQGARADAAQGRAGLRLAARQARRLPGERPFQIRTVHRRGRLGRRQCEDRAAIANSRRCCRCAARYSMSSGRVSTRC